MTEQHWSDSYHVIEELIEYSEFLPDFSKENCAIVFSTDDQNLEEPGKLIVKSYLEALIQQDVKPRYIILKGSGVKLAMTVEQQLETAHLLIALERAGVTVLICRMSRNCLIPDEMISAGIVVSVLEIQEVLMKIKKVIHLS